jgi:hypothetical protein
MELDAAAGEAVTSEPDRPIWTRVPEFSVSGEPRDVALAGRPEERGQRDGRRDFDFLLGSWDVRNHRLTARLCGTTDWEEFPGVCRVRPILCGLGNMDEFTIHAPDGRAEAVTVRLYSPASGEWTIYWAASPGPGRFDVPMVGRFEGGRGEFYSQEVYEGRHIFSRFIWTVGSADACRWEQAYSLDGGREWETNWIMEFRRRS